MMLRALLDFAIQDGALALIDERGQRHDFGDGSAPEVVIRTNDPALGRKLVMSPTLGFAEAYMDGRLELEQGTLRQMVEVLMRNMPQLQDHPVLRRTKPLLGAVHWLGSRNPVAASRRNVTHHYDLKPELYRAFLDRDMQYSCAYFPKPDTSLDEAQLEKKRHIAAKLLLDRPELEVLDIGSGWGGMGLYLARESGCKVTGLTLSTEQLAIANERAAEAGLDGQAGFHLRDYRHETGQYDRIVSVGMFEHVGPRNFEDFFGQIERLLKPDGICLLHTIGSGARHPPEPFIRKYIFPGGYIPTLSEIAASIERYDLFVTDVEVLRLHYAETLRHWHERFMARREEIEELYDERFCRMWECYLLGAEMGFRHLWTNVFQIQITRSREALPLTRDYMVDWERASRARDRRRTEDRDAAAGREAAE